MYSSINMECGGKKMVLKPIRTSKKFDDDDEEEEAVLLSPGSRMFHEPNFNIHIVAIMGWKIPLDIDSLKAQLLSKLLKHPRFSSLQVIYYSSSFYFYLSILLKI